jgi:hypothetical protein
MLEKILILFLATGNLGTAGPPVEEKQEPKTPTDIRQASDSSVDRNIWLPTAEILPAGDFVINVYELFYCGLSYAPTDYMQLSFTGAIPYAGIKSALLNSKFQLIRTENFILSVQPTIGAYFNYRHETVGFALGTLFDWVIDDGGNYVLSVSHNFVFAHNWKEGVEEYRDLDFKQFFMSLTSLCLNARVLDHFKFFLELMIYHGDVEGWGSQLMGESILLGYGLRISSASFSIDFSFIRPMTSEGLGGWGLGLPYLAFSIRL